MLEELFNSNFIQSLLGSSVGVTLFQTVSKWLEDQRLEKRKALELVHKIELLILNIEWKRENKEWSDQIYKHEEHLQPGFYQPQIFKEVMTLLETVDFNCFNKINFILQEDILSLQHSLIEIKNNLSQMSDVLEFDLLVDEFRKNYIMICYKLLMISENLRSLYRFKKRILYFGNINLNDFYRDEFGKIDKV